MISGAQRYVYLAFCYRDECFESKAMQSIESAEANMERSDSFDKALQSVEEALVRLEKLLQEMHVSSSGSGKEHLKAACSDLEKIRKLKKEAEFLEASFRAKAFSLQEEPWKKPGVKVRVLDMTCKLGLVKGARIQSSLMVPTDLLENGGGISLSSTEQTRFMKGKDKGDGVGAGVQDKNSCPGGFWNFLIRPSVKKLAPDSSNLEEETTDGSLVANTDANTDARKSSSSEINRFETLRIELTELEKRLQRSTAKSENQKVQTAKLNVSLDYFDTSFCVKLVGN
ncbi:hypothetical protein Cgig2_017609 [Carnegiea gigantea]|uniref:Uncharacterized protein n=1 Tax=Carnegiea gigantea TaxID=171969 RepID=A0A9Q1JJG8_9CARY|nr:hypothetical protein Cgig2_017609 [Carnegiea gigantea]